MLTESVRALRRRNDPNAVLIPRRRHTWAHGLPLKMRFRTSKLYVSAIPPFVIGAVVGILAAIMGVGGGFIMVPAMIYLIGMPTKVVVGTSVFQFLFVTGFTAVLHATQSGTVDVMLALILLIGGVIGAQIGVGLAARLRAEQLRILLAAPRPRRLPQALRRPRDRTRRALLDRSLVSGAAAGRAPPRPRSPRRWQPRRPWSPASPPTTSRSTPPSTAPSSSSSARSAATRPPPPGAGPLDIIITIKGPPQTRHGAPQGAPASGSGSTPSRSACARRRASTPSPPPARSTTS